MTAPVWSMPLCLSAFCVSVVCGPAVFGQVVQDPILVYLREAGAWGATIVLFLVCREQLRRFGAEMSRERAASYSVWKKTMDVADRRHEEYQAALRRIEESIGELINVLEKTQHTPPRPRGGGVQ